MRVAVLLFGALLGTQPQVTPQGDKPMNGGRLIGGATFACGLGGTAVALDVMGVTQDPDATFPEALRPGLGTTVPTQHAAIPVCVHMAVAGAALRGRSDGRRDRLAGVRRDTSGMFEAGLGLAISGPLITGLGFGSALLVQKFHSRDIDPGAETITLGALGAGGVVTFTTGLSLIASARNYESEFGRPAGVWAPRGIGGITMGALFGLGSLVMPAISTQVGFPPQFAPALTRPLFGSVLLGAVGTHMLGHWQLEHRDGPQLRQRAHRVFVGGVSLLSLAPALGIGLILVSTSDCSDGNTGKEILGGLPILSACERQWRTGAAVLGMAGLVSLEIGAAMLSYGMVFRKNHRHRELGQTLSPWMLPRGFGLAWSGRF